MARHGILPSDDRFRTDGQDNDTSGPTCPNPEGNKTEKWDDSGTQPDPIDRDLAEQKDGDREWLWESDDWSDGQHQ